ncbi:pentapeptide repeat-containing protein [Saccharothrix violaceirubra]|uniref:Pentapeptide repeat protein n=1 Tax=Saccharothrix violaceirubra TaxID=413306 RepID=A0A7W7T0J6_9PSEU|nr:pentapeptide repeat-containing protein [Saccharothrix violaceirubra]MBB4964285.1 hypothetical protein [Saccharothrix violaceirubra]
MTELRADCARCVGLCCVVPAFAKSVDFAIDKPAHTPCPNLADDFRCGIHTRLREKGFRGCTVYDCFGAGQQVTQVTFGGTPTARARAVFPVMRQLHELLWYLTEAARIAPDRATTARLDEIAALTRETPENLLALDVGPWWREVDAIMVKASEAARKGLRGKNKRNADLVGKDLSRAGLRGATLRGAYLIGARLRGADLRRVDFTGADLRDADLSGADLREAFFLTQSQLDAARGDRTTRLPEGLRAPAHW